MNKMYSIGMTGAIYATTTYTYSLEFINEIKNIWQQCRNGLCLLNAKSILALT
jgi:hypothetical protein